MHKYPLYYFFFIIICIYISEEIGDEYN